MKKLFRMLMPKLGFALEGAGNGGGEFSGGSDLGGGGELLDSSGFDGFGGDNGFSGSSGVSHEEYLTYARANGAFEHADQYNIPTTFEGVEIPESLAAQWDVGGDAKLFAGMAAKHGLTQAQAEGVFKDYVTSALEVTSAAEQEGIASQNPEVILKQVYGEGKVQEALPFLERGMKALGIDVSKGLRTHHAMKAITELGRLTGEDSNFRNAGTGFAGDEKMSAEEWLKQA